MATNICFQCHRHRIADNTIRLSSIKGHAGNTQERHYGGGFNVYKLKWCHMGIKF